MGAGGKTDLSKFPEWMPLHPTSLSPAPGVSSAVALGRGSPDGDLSACCRWEGGRWGNLRFPGLPLGGRGGKMRQSSSHFCEKAFRALVAVRYAKV